MWSSQWNENWQGKPKYSEKTCPIATLSTTNPTWPDLGSNPGHRRMPATKCLSYGTGGNLMYVIDSIYNCCLEGHVRIFCYYLYLWKFVLVCMMFFVHIFFSQNVLNECIMVMSTFHLWNYLMDLHTYISVLNAIYYLVTLLLHCIFRLYTAIIKCLLSCWNCCTVCQDYISRVNAIFPN
jgi:hypothetical protein